LIDCCENDSIVFGISTLVVSAMLVDASVVAIVVSATLKETIVVNSLVFSVVILVVSAIIVEMRVEVTIVLSVDDAVVSGRAAVVVAATVVSMGDELGTIEVITVMIVLNGSVVEMDVVSGGFVVEITVGRMVVGVTINKSNTHTLQVDKEKIV
jgi:hypothetical protein